MRRYSYLYAVCRQTVSRAVSQPVSSRSSIGCCLLAAAMLLGQAGCDKVSELADSVQDQLKQAPSPQQVVEQVKQATGKAGDFEVQLDAPLKIAGCYAQWIRLKDRPSVLQISGYETPEGETFPSYFVRIITDETEPAALLNKPLPAEAYVQTEANGPMWMVDSGKPIEVTVTAATNDQFAADIRGPMINTKTGATAEINGKFHGSFKSVP